MHGMPRGCFSGIAALIVSVSAQSALAQAVLHVDGDNGVAVPANPPGETWGNAYKYLQDALARAEVLLITEPEVEIWVAATVSANPYRADRDAANPNGTGIPTSFDLLPDVKVLGGFVGGETEATARRPSVNVTELSGDLLGNDTPGQPATYLDNSRPVVVGGPSVGSNAVLGGFLVTKGYAPNQLGGGFLIDGASPRFARCRFENNEAKGGGGGHVDPGSAPLLLDCQIRSNQSDTVAGGVCTFNADLTLVNCVVVNNVSESSGAGILIKAEGDESADLTVVNCTIADNQIDSGLSGLTLAGGIQAGDDGNGGDIVIVNSVIWGNVGLPGVTVEESQLVLDTGFTSTVSYTCIEGLTVYAGNNNIGDDPEFGPGVFRLQSTSPCIDVRNNAAIDEPEFEDVLDFDDDDDTSEPVPDLDDGDRIEFVTLSTTVDMGAYEHTICPLDINGDQEISFGDLLAVLSNWGPCPPGPTCEADLNGDSLVNFQDLLLVLSNWGPCSNLGSLAPPQSVTDCIQRYGLDPENLAKCIEAMMLAGTP